MFYTQVFYGMHKLKWKPSISTDLQRQDTFGNFQFFERTDEVTPLTLACIALSSRDCFQILVEDRFRVELEESLKTILEEVWGEVSELKSM